MTPAEEERRAAEADALLRNPLWLEAYAAIEERLVSVLSSADTANDRRIRCCDLLASLKTVRRHFEQVVMTGRMAAMQIEQQKSLADRAKERLARFRM